MTKRSSFVIPPVRTGTAVETVAIIAPPQKKVLSISSNSSETGAVNTTLPNGGTAPNTTFGLRQSAQPGEPL